MVEDRDSERPTDVCEAVSGPDDEQIGMRIDFGTEVGGYVIDGELGHGGTGVVYGATHPVIGKRAAIKILRLDVSRSPSAIERFIQEARAVNQIRHPNIIDIFAYGALPDGRAYHVMDLLVGESLRQRLGRGVLHPSETASVIDEIASALMAAHDHGFVHRDLKPDNVFLVHRDDRWPEVKLLDFGLAKLMPEYGTSAITTKTGQMLGTPEYMSPEQARGTGVDFRTDIYALGLVMFEMLAGHRPFPALGDPLATLLQHAEEPPASLADTVAGLPGEMVQLVSAMLAKTPEARPSLAAVRTVIKRLRATQLPARSVAGLELASLHGPTEPLPAITASRVGAEAVLPEDSLLPDRRISQPPDRRIWKTQTTTPGIGSDVFRSRSPRPSLLAAARPAPPRELRPLPGLEPQGPSIDPVCPPPGGQPMQHPIASSHSPHSPHSSPSSHPSHSSHSSHSSPSSHSSHSSPLSHSSHSSPSSHSSHSLHPPPGARPAGASSEALRSPSQGLPPIRFGVSPSPPSTARPRPRRTWLAVAGLLVIAGGVALAIALIGI